MFKRLREHLRDNKGDVYIQMLICTLTLLLVSVIIISIASSINSKMWLEEQLNDLVRVVENTGCTTTEAGTNIENVIKAKFGGTFTYEGQFINNNSDHKGRIQLNDSVVITYHCDEYVALRILGVDISSPINLQKLATSNVYYKTEDTRIDP